MADLFLEIDYEIPQFVEAGIDSFGVSMVVHLASKGRSPPNGRASNTEGSEDPRSERLERYYGVLPVEDFGAEGDSTPVKFYKPGKR